MNFKTISKRCLFLIFCLCINTLFGQRIRKDHREMTPSEKSVFVEALKLSKSYIVQEGLHHQCHAGEVNSTCPEGGLIDIHQAAFFLPWHRIFQYYIETNLRQTNTSNAQNVTIPYWDWRVETTAAEATWDDQNFLGQFDDPSETIWMYLGRFWREEDLDDFPLITPNGSVNGAVNYLLGLSSFSSFTGASEIQGPTHIMGHQLISSVMSSQTSPWDPVFYLHHGMLDKIWQDWEDNVVDHQSEFANTVTPHYTINPNDVVDSRYLQYVSELGQDVWYAYNKKLLLDGSLASDFTPNTNKLYCYTAWNGSTVEGTIFAGDVKRDASDNVVADNKGGFQIPSGKTVDFRAGKAIYLMGGFKTVRGATFSAKCVTTPCGFSSNTLVSPGTPELSALDIPKSTESNAKIQIVPNPIDDALNVQYEVETEAVVQIHVFNVLGQVVAQYQPGIQAPGKYSYSVTTQGWSKGIYNCRVSIGKESTSVKAVH